MPISGYFTDLSFPEVLRFIHTSHKTGKLQIRAISSGQLQAAYHLWFRNGDIVAVQHPYLSLQTLLARVCEQPLEVIRYHSAISAHTLAADWHRAQAARPCSARTIADGLQSPSAAAYCLSLHIGNAWFKFEASSALPFEEMTGLSLSPIQAALNGLRRLKNWDYLRSKLPEATSRLQRTSKSFLPYQLSSEEAYLWNLANADLPLLEISSKLGLPVEETQKLAFRLIITGLVDECPDTQASASAAEPTVIDTPAESAPLSTSFISNLLGFLKQRA